MRMLSSAFGRSGSSQYRATNERSFDATDGMGVLTERLGNMPSFLWVGAPVYARHLHARGRQRRLWKGAPAYVFLCGCVFRQQKWSRAPRPTAVSSRLYVP